MLTKGGVSQIGVLVSLLLVYLTVRTYGQANETPTDIDAQTLLFIPDINTRNSAGGDFNDTTNSSTLPSAQTVSPESTISLVVSSETTEGEPTQTISIQSTTASVTFPPFTKNSVSSTSGGESTFPMPSSPVSSVSITSSVVSSTSVSTTGNMSILTNTTSTPETFKFTPGLTIGIVIGLIGLVIIAVFISFQLKRRKKSYRICKIHCCYRCFKFKRLRSSSTGSHGPLTPDDATSVDIPSTNRDEELFTIEDQDGGHDGRPSFSRHDSDDDYFYDEIFDRSAFQDRKTIQSNKHLTLSGDEELDDFDGEFDIPDLVFKKPFSRI